MPAAPTKSAPPKNPPAPEAKYEASVWPIRNILIGIVMLAIVVGSLAFYQVKRNSGSKNHAANKAVQVPTGEAQYFALAPAFVVNLADDGEPHYLQVDIQLMTRDAELSKAIEHHAPAIRNRLLLLFSEQHANQLVERKGKERLQALALNEARRVLKTETGKAGIEALYFTSFVVQ